MKKLLFLLMFPILCFGQGGYYDENNSDVSKICDFYRGNSFASNTSADNALDRILSVTGMSKRFVLYPCSNIDNCLATSYKGIRYILYDKYFMQEIANNTGSWSKISILAHEVGHHVNGHSIDLLSIASGQIDAPSLKESRQMEIEADEYSGFVMQKLGASLSQAQAAMNKYASTGDDSYSSHPSKYKRMAAVERGYNRAKGQSSIYSNTSSTLTAEDYFYRAYNAPENSHQFKIDNYDMCINLNFKYKSAAYYNRAILKNTLKDYYGAIADYTKAIELEPEYASAYNNRGLSKQNLKDFYGAIEDFTKVISLNPDDANTYYNRGGSKIGLKDYYGAIADLTKVIELNPKNASAYGARGIAKSALKLNACGDYKKACDLGDNNMCEWWTGFCGRK